MKFSTLMLERQGAVEILSLNRPAGAQRHLARDGR